MRSVVIGTLHGRGETSRFLTSRISGPVERERDCRRESSSGAGGGAKRRRSIGMLHGRGETVRPPLFRGA